MIKLMSSKFYNMLLQGMQMQIVEQIDLHQYLFKLSKFTNHLDSPEGN